MMQLKPCMGRFICDDPINNSFKVTHSLNPRWKMFKSLILEINHRQGNDKPYADLLNRIRVGKHTEEDIALLRTRVRLAKSPDLKEVGLYIVCKRKECAQINEEYLNSLPGELLTIKARHHHATQKKYKPYIEPKDGAVATTSFIDELKLKIGGKLMIIHNINTVDSLTNGQLGVLITVIKTTSGEVDKLIIRLQNKNAGMQNKQNHPGLAKRFPGCIIIERVSNQYTLRRKGGDVAATATVIQFPVKLAFAITSHKIQGQTIPWPMTVVLDIQSIFEDAQAHVMLSRVQQLKQIYILKTFDESKIRTSRTALEEKERLAKISMNVNPSPWHRDSKNTIKVVSLNCAGLKPHFKDIQVDDTVLKGDIIHLVETSLEIDDKNPLNLCGYEVHTMSVGNGKGLTTYFKACVFKNQLDFIAPNMQATKFCSENLDVINVYRSSKGNSLDLLNKLVEMVTPGMSTLITGDFNICFSRNPNNRMSKGLVNAGFQQLVRESTHILGGHIDHVYWMSRNNQWKEPILQRHSPYYSDHDAICITMNEKVKF